MEATKEQIEKYKKEIDEMTQEDMARLLRFHPSGHFYFIRDTELCNYFYKKFQEAGGMTSKISKEIGWG